MRYVREPDAITAALRVTTRIRSSTRVTLMLRWMGLRKTSRGSFRGISSLMVERFAPNVTWFKSKRSYSSDYFAAKPDKAVPKAVPKMVL
jgi:hypothetical protein